MNSIDKPETRKDKNQVEATRESETDIREENSQGEKSVNEDSLRSDLKGKPSSSGGILKNENTPVGMPATLQNNATLCGSNEDVPKTVNEEKTGEDDGDDDDVIEIVDLTGDDFAGHLDTQESGSVSKKTIKISLITKVEPKKDTGRKGDQKITEKITSPTLSKIEESDTDSDADINEISSSPEWLSVEKAVMSKPKGVNKKGKRKTKSKYASFLQLKSTDACMTINDSNNTDDSESSAGLSKKEIEERAEVKRQAMGFVCETDSESDTDESSAPDSPGADMLYDDYVELTSSDSDNENGLSRKSKGRKSSSRNQMDSKKKGGNGKEAGNRDSQQGWLNTKKQSHAVNNSDNQEKVVSEGNAEEIDKECHVAGITENVIRENHSPCKEAMVEDKDSVPNSQDMLSNQESGPNNIDTEKMVPVNAKENRHDEALSAESKEEKSESLPVDPTTSEETVEKSKDKAVESKLLENKETIKSTNVESNTSISIKSAQQETNQVKKNTIKETTVDISSNIDKNIDSFPVLSDNVNNTILSKPSSESPSKILKNNEATNTVKTPAPFGDQPAPPGTEDPLELPGKPVKENTPVLSPKDTSEKQENKGSDTTSGTLKTFYPLPPSDQPAPPGTEEPVSDTANKISPVISANRSAKKHTVTPPAWPEASSSASDNSSSSPLYNLFVAGKAAPPTFQPPPTFPPPYGYPPPPLGTVPNYPPPPLGQGSNFPSYPPNSGWGPYSQNQYGNYPLVAYPSYNQTPPSFPYTQPPPTTASNASSTYSKSSASTVSKFGSTHSKTKPTAVSKSVKTERNESQYVVSKPPVLNANYKPGSKTASKTFSNPHSSETQSKSSHLDIPIPESDPEPKTSQSNSKAKKLASWQQKKAELFERGPSKIAKKEVEPKIKINIGKPPSRLASEQTSQQSRQHQTANPYSMTENMAQMVRQGVYKNEPVVDMSSIKANIAALTGIKFTTNPAPQQSESENLPELMQRLKSLEKVQAILEAVSYKPEQQGQGETKQTFEYGHTGLNQPEYDKYRRDDPYQRRERRDSLPEEPRSRYDYDRTERERSYHDRREQDYERRLRDEEAYEHWLRDRRYDDYNRDRGLRPPPPRSHAYDAARYDERPPPPRPIPRDAEYEEWLRRRRAGDPYRTRRDSYDRYDDYPPPPPRPRSPYDRPLSPYDRALPPYDRPLPRSPIDRPMSNVDRGYYDRDPYRGDIDRRTGVPDRYEPRYAEHSQSNTQSSSYSDSHYQAATSTAGQYASEYQTEPRPQTYHQPTSQNEPMSRGTEFIKKPLVARVLSRSGHLLSVQSASEALQHTQDYQ